MQLTNTSTGAIAYEWNFGDDDNSEFENPVVTYTTQGAYIITLIASNQFNCQDTAHNPVNIYPMPVIQSVNVQPMGGCQPLNVLFTANATNASQYVWNFGDGTSFESSTPFATHLYQDTGTFSVRLQVYSYSKCGDTITLADTVTVHVNPMAAFDYIMNQNVEPVNGTVQFVNNSTNADSYQWHFGDGVGSTEINPSHMFEDVNQFHV